MEIEKIKSTVLSLFDIYQIDDSVYIPNEIIGIIDSDKLILDGFKDIDIRDYINKSRNKHLEELTLLLDASQEQLNVLNQLEREISEKTNIYSILEEKNKKVKEESEVNKNLNSKLEEQAITLKNELDKEKYYTLVGDKQSKRYLIVKWLIYLLGLIIVIFGVNLLKNPENNDNLNAFKDIILIIVGGIIGSISTFLGKSESKEEQQKPCG